MSSFFPLRRAIMRSSSSSDERAAWARARATQGRPLRVERPGRRKVRVRPQVATDGCTGGNGGVASPPCAAPRPRSGWSAARRGACTQLSRRALSIGVGAAAVPPGGTGAGVASAAPGCAAPRVMAARMRAMSAASCSPRRSNALIPPLLSGAPSGAGAPNSSPKSLRLTHGSAPPSAGAPTAPGAEWATSTKACSRARSAPGAVPTLGAQGRSSCVH